MIKRKTKAFHYRGFTLAEVLVTLMVIGIVASETMPGLINSFQTSVYKVGYRKAYSDLSQAVVNGIADEKWTPRTTIHDDTVAAANFAVLQGYFGKVKVCDTNNNDECWEATGEKAGTQYPTSGAKAFIDKSGRAWSQYYYTQDFFLVDTNGFDPPNQYGKDRWQFIFVDRNNTMIGNASATSTIPEKVVPYRLDDDLTYNSDWCKNPPCYFKSWLIGDN